MTGIRVYVGELIAPAAAPQALGLLRGTPPQTEKIARDRRKLVRFGLLMAWLWAANGAATAPSTSVRPADALIA